MRSEIPTHLTLTQFTSIMGLNHWLMAGYSKYVPETPLNKVSGKNCMGVWSEYTYQTNKLSRQDVVAAINRAEDTIAHVINFWPAPHATVAEEVDYPDPFRGYRQTTDELKTVKLRFGKIIQLGKQVRTILSESVALEFSSVLHLKVKKPQGLEVEINDTFEAEVEVPDGTTPDQIEAYFTAEDRLDEPRERWQIRPITVTIEDTTATIKGKAYLLAPPSLVIRVDAEELDATNDEHFVQAIEVVLVTFDRTQAGLAFWENGGCGSPVCDDTSQSVCAYIRNRRLGTVAPIPGIYDTETGQNTTLSPASCHPPKKVEMNYISGVPLASDGLIDPTYAEAIAKLAASYFECETCACNCTAERLMAYRGYERILVSEGGGSKGYSVPKPPLNSFGDRWGQVTAWNILKPHKIFK